MNVNKNADGRYFQLSNFYLACFLLSKGLELVNIQKGLSDPKRSEFVFRDIPQREQLVHSFNFAPEDSRDVSIDAREFIAAIKTMKDKLYQEKF